MSKLRTIAKSTTMERMEIAFKICYLLLTFISFNTFFARQWYLSYMAYAIVAFGFVIGLARLTHIKDYINKNIIVLVLFVISYIISSINTIEYGYMENIQALIWMCIQYFLIFAFDKTRSFESISKEKNIISWVTITYTFIAALIAMIMMACGWSYFNVIDGYNIFGGFLWHRLFGCYMDCNYGAVLSVISIVISAYYFKKSNRTIKAFLILNIVLEYLFVCYSDSRTGLLALLTSSLVFITCALYRSDDNKFDIKQFVKSAIIALLISAVLVGLAIGIKNLSSNIIVENAVNKARINGASYEEQVAVMEDTRLGRSSEELGYGSSDNPRILIWESAFEIYKAHPIVGVSFRNIMISSVYEQPDLYIVQNGYDSMHNFIFDVLASQGTIGIIIVAILFALAIIGVIKTFNSYSDYGVTLAVVAAVFASMLPYSETFYMNTPGAFLFWFMLGYMINYRLQKGKKENVEREN